MRRLLLTNGSLFIHSIDIRHGNGMKIEASSCSRCGQTIVPPRETCPYCGNSAGVMTSLSLDNRGVIVSYTTLNVPPEEFSSPVRLALVKLEKDVIILSLADSNDIVHIDSKVEIMVDNENRFRYRVLK